jgi:hypothetical protein
MGTAYATRRDVYRFGLPRGTLGSEGRLVGSASASTNLIQLEDHGFETDDEIVFRATEGGSLSSPLVEGTTYYAIRVSDSTFQVAAAPWGAPIDLTTDGASMMVATSLPFDDVLELYSRFVDGVIPHLIPLVADKDGKFPTVVTAVVAELAAKKLQALSGVTSVSVSEAEKSARAQLESWAKGVPIRDTRATASANLAVTNTLASITGDPRGWGSRNLP